MTTYNQACARQLQHLCGALKLEHHAQEYVALQRFLFEPWGDREVPRRPAFASLIGDDHSPYEYSVAFSRSGTELRLLLEAQGERPDLASNQRAALELNARIAERFSIDLARFREIEGLFLPPDPKPPFSLWHAVCLNGPQRPEFKIYVNPQVRGASRAGELVGLALDRLGYAEAARLLAENVAVRGPGRDEVRYFSLDLDDTASARVKVYFCHYDATADEIERIFALAPSHWRGDVTQFCRAIVGHAGPFANKPLCTCFAFTEQSAVPKSVTLHLPVSHYLRNDADTVGRVLRFLQANRLGGGSYARAIASFGHRALDESIGIQSYASYRRERSGIRFTAYCSPELFDAQLRENATGTSATHRIAADQSDERDVDSSAGGNSR